MVAAGRGVSMMVCSWAVGGLKVAWALGESMWWLMGFVVVVCCE